MLNVVDGGKDGGGYNDGSSGVVSVIATVLMVMLMNTKGSDGFI
jgi:hypothetical protein